MDTGDQGEDEEGAMETEDGQDEEEEGKPDGKQGVEPQVGWGCCKNIKCQDGNVIFEVEINVENKTSKKTL